MVDRTGPFWDGVAGRAPVPPAAATLGFELLDADVDAGTMAVGFAAIDDFITPTGEVLGGFLAAMLFDTVGPTVLATLGPHQFIQTLEMHSVFLHPTRPGRLIGRGRLVRRDGDIAFVEATLHDADDVPVATATSTIRVIPLPDRRAE